MATKNTKKDTMDQQFCLRWNNFQANITSQFETLRNEEDFVDVTFACGGRLLGAHKIVLSACSPYFKQLFKNNTCAHPVIFMRDVEIRQLETLLEFVYSGEVNIVQNELLLFLKTAEALQIRGLTEASSQHKSVESPNQESVRFSNHKNENNPPASPISQNNDKKIENGKRIQTPENTISKRNCPNNRNEEYIIKHENITEEANFELTESELNLSSEMNEIGNEIVEKISDDFVEPKIELPNYDSDNLSNNADENLMNLDFDSMPTSFDMNPTAGTSQLSIDNSTESSQVNNTSSSLLSQQIPTRKTSIDNPISNQNQHRTTKPLDNNPPNNRTLHSLERRPCPICGRVYSNHSNLRQHINLIHSPEAMTCPLCQKSFRTKLYLRRHIASFHNETHPRFGLNSENAWSRDVISKNSTSSNQNSNGLGFYGKIGNEFSQDGVWCEIGN